MIVVIPSNRSVNLDHLTPLIEYGSRFIVIDDTKGCIKINHPQFAVYNWADRKRLLGRNEAAVPQGNAACRDLGFYIAWREGDDDEIVVALDDDCVAESADFPKQIYSVLGPRARQVATGPGRHFNIFDIYEGVDSSRVFPRGFPYSQRVAYQRWNLDQTIQAESHFNVGLWKGVFDINAIDKIRLSQTNFPNTALIYDTVIVPQGTLISACGANLHFRRSLIPAVYQLPMNLEIMPSWPLNRYGDIWGGFILKMLMDIRGDVMSVGGPLVRHQREGLLDENIANEHLGHLVNDEFITLMSQACENVEPASYLDMMKQLREQLKRFATELSPISHAYLTHLDRSLLAWLQALDS